MLACNMPIALSRSMGVNFGIVKQKFHFFFNVLSTWDVREQISVVCTCVNFNGLSEHKKNLKTKIRSVHWFGLTELNKTMESMG